MNVFRKCPNCSYRLGISRIILPLVKGDKHRIECENCGTFLSKEHKNYNFPILTIFALTVLIGKVPRWMGYNFSWYYSLIAYICFVLIALIVFYYLFPLKRQL